MSCSQAWIWCRLLPASQSLTLSSSNPSPQRLLGVTELLALATTQQVAFSYAWPNVFLKIKSRGSSWDDKTLPKMAVF